MRPVNSLGWSTSTPRSAPGLLLLLGVAWLGSACGGSSATSGSPPLAAGGEATAEHAIAVQIAPVRQGPLSSLYSASATLRADKQATITARTQGVVRNLLAEEGDRVTARQILARLEDDEQRIAYARAQSTREAQTREFERTARLYEDGLVSQEEYDDRRRAADDAIHAASLAELELARTVIRAPFTGVVVRRYLDVGATVANGTSVYELADLDPLYADVNVPERHVVHLAPGQEVRLRAEAYDQVIPATIIRIAPAVDPQAGTVKVTLAVSGLPRIRPGAFVRVSIVTATHPQALVVPRPAVVAEGRRSLLFRLGEDHQVEQLEVKTGFEEGNRVEIVEVLGGATPLEPGNSVVVAGAPALSDGARVRVVGPQDDGEAGVAP
ncbi:MAG: efflux RND transporter periplasmic adaptor subunit [Acidobacteriota bacterium]